MTDTQHRDLMAAVMVAGLMANPENHGSSAREYLVTAYRVLDEMPDVSCLAEEDLWVSEEGVCKI